jgi:hypothetical protein
MARQFLKWSRLLLTTAILSVPVSFISCRESAPEAQPAKPAASGKKPLGALFGIKQNGKYGYIDRTGEIVVKPQFEEVLPFITIPWYDIVFGTLTAPVSYYWPEGGMWEDLAAVNIRGKWGCIDRTGKVVTEPQFDSFFFFCEGRAAVRAGGKWGYIDKKLFHNRGITHDRQPIC